MTDSLGPDNASANLGVPIGAASIELWFDCYQFLSHEAGLLDDNRMDDWLNLLHPSISYEIPIRLTRRRGEAPLDSGAWHMNENLDSLQMRVARLGTKSAWGEDPPSRTRRLIGNLRCAPINESSVSAISNILIYYGRGDEHEHILIAAERHDVLYRVDGYISLIKRDVVLSHATLPVQSIGIFI
jgi:ethylbenzene dioxygenase beta subunit